MYFMRVLLIEDEYIIAEPTIACLKMNNYQVTLMMNGEDGLIEGFSNIYDIILLDIMLPKMDGLEVLQRLRKSKVKTPILLLTAKNQVMDRINGFDLGADDYLPKPFEYSELLARMRALLRRSGSLQETNTLIYSNMELHPFNALLKTEKGEQKLTLKESQLLELLMTRTKMITPKDLIIEKLWDFDREAGDSNVEYHISKLRRKMKLLEASASIKIIRGLGYYLEEC